MEKKKILIVDDERELIEQIRTRLEYVGHEVTCATDGFQALEMVRSVQPNLILLDVVMPKMNGYQVCRELKGTVETKSIPIILLTAKAQESDKFWGKETGANDYITKPFEMEDLIQKIDYHLRNGR